MKKIKKILIVGYFGNDSNIYTYAKSFYNNFKILSYKVSKFDYRKSYFCNISLILKIFFTKPDLIFFIKAEKISHRTINIIKNKFQSFLVNFYPDNPFSFWNGNSNSYVLNSFPFYDYFLIWSRILIPAIKSAGCKKVYYFPFAYDQEIFPENISINDDEKEYYDSDVCFIGTWEPLREKWLTNLCKSLPDLKLLIWGNLWDKKISKNSILKSRLKDDAIYGIKMIKAFRCSKIVLNFIREQNIESHNMRTFEVLASKSFLLTQRTYEQKKLLFKEGESLECFSDVDELIIKIKFYLIEKKACNKIINNGYEEVKKYKLLTVLKKYINFLEQGESSE